jgi:hypothetical protein
LLLETVFSIRFMQSGYKEEDWGSQFNWALQGRLRRDGDPVSCQLKVSLRREDQEVGVK